MNSERSAPSEAGNERAASTALSSAVPLSVSPWRVQIHGSAQLDYEISALRTDYYLGQRSWGWDMPGLKIIVAKSIGGPDAQAKFDHYVRMAQAIADALTAAGL
jgi:hypothetical protein